MIYIVPIAVIGILLLHASGAVPLTGVGGAMAVGFALLAAAPAVGIHEAWTKGLGLGGWIVNIAVAFLGAFIAAPLGGFLVAMLLGRFANGTSLAASDGPVMYVALALMMTVALAGSWVALRIVDRWR